MSQIKPPWQHVSAKTLIEGDELMDSDGAIRQIFSLQPYQYSPFSQQRPGVDIVFTDRSYRTLSPTEQVWRRPGPALDEFDIVIEATATEKA